MTKLTPFGIAIRKLRLDKGMRLMDLAENLDQSAAFVSAIETGRKAIPDGYVLKVARAMNLSAEEMRALRGAADRTRKEVRVDELANDQRELVAAFARRLNDVPDDVMERIKKIVFESRSSDMPFARKRRGIVVPPMSTGKLRRFAEKVRNVFVSESQIEFPIMEVLEFRLQRVLPEFILDIQDEETMGDDEGCVPAGSNSIVFRADVYEGAWRGNGRDRFTACHEFAHFLMHRDLKLARARDDDDKIYVDSEWQADEFAGTLLMSPRHLPQFHDADSAASACKISASAARVMWAKYTKEGRFDPNISSVLEVEG